ncbi:MAG: hypothetical protein BRD46_02775 [Bacteroidetes bacterium QS_8_68_15]|nr:MAG: hypothetical protein BRD46_02775 [Bacteroidetes bacterium QS_8_68_15]
METEFLGRTFTSVQRSHPRAEYVSVGALITNPTSFEEPAGSRMAPEGALRLDPARLSEGGRAGVQARAAGWEILLNRSFFETARRVAPIPF